MSALEPVSVAADAESQSAPGPLGSRPRGAPLWTAVPPPPRKDSRSLWLGGSA